jgi:hypothetical protein
MLWCLIKHVDNLNTTGTFTLPNKVKATSFHVEHHQADKQGHSYFGHRFASLQGSYSDYEFL